MPCSNLECRHEYQLNIILLQKYTENMTKKSWPPRIWIYFLARIFPKNQSVYWGSMEFSYDFHRCSWNVPRFSWDFQAFPLHFFQATQWCFSAFIQTTFTAIDSHQLQRWVFRDFFFDICFGWLVMLVMLVGWLVGRLVGYVGWLVVDFDLLVQNNSPAKFRIELHENVVFSLFPLDSSFECHEGNISIEHVWVIWIGYIIATVCSNYSSQLERLNQLNPTLWKSPACLDLHVWIPQRTFSPLRLGAYGNDLHLISCKHISTLIIHHNEAQE